MTLIESFAASRALTQERAKNFYFGIRLLPEEKRDALCAVYAYFRICDDLSDDENVLGKEDRLRQWRSFLQPDPSHAKHHAILPAFYHTCERYQIPDVYFHDLLDGTVSDLTVTRYQNFEDLYRYCYRVASTVGLVCLHVFGFDGSATALAAAEARGIAFQLTNILRDVSEDSERGRIYLPLEDLERFGLTETDFLAGIPTTSFEPFLTFQVERAKHYYDLSQNLVDHVEQDSRSCLQAMTRIYEALLLKIKDLGPRIFQERARLNKLEKITIAGKALLGMKS